MGDGISGPIQSQFNQAEYCTSSQYLASAAVPSVGATSWTHSCNSPQDTVTPFDWVNVLLGFISTRSPAGGSRQMLPESKMIVEN